MAHPIACRSRTANFEEDRFDGSHNTVDSEARIAASTVERHRYELAELIDLAQRLNPETHEAWEQARQAALAVGLVESNYAPQISIEAIAGFQRTPASDSDHGDPQRLFHCEHC